MDESLLPHARQTEQTLQPIIVKVGAYRVLSRHRLPTRLRLPIVVLWLLPGLLFTATIALSRGAAAFPSLLDPRWWGLLLVMAVPALYIWREGVDVVEWPIAGETGVEHGLIRRIHTPRAYRFHDLSRWTCRPRLPTAPGGLLTIYDRQQAKALECHAAHLTDMPRLLQTLRDHLPGESSRGETLPIRTSG